MVTDKIERALAAHGVVECKTVAHRIYFNGLYMYSTHSEKHEIVDEVLSRFISRFSLALTDLVDTQTPPSVLQILVEGLCSAALEYVRADVSNTNGILHPPTEECETANSLTLAPTAKQQKKKCLTEFVLSYYS